MSESEPRKRGAKRFLSPSQKYEIWLQQARQEASVAEVASAQEVDRCTIMRIKQVAKWHLTRVVAAVHVVGTTGLRAR
ncbi:MAG: hypothetical protein KAG80_01880 [Nocardioides sp.]|nr:hypothetical protein [Nocardioides sp.]